MFEKIESPIVFSSFVCAVSLVLCYVITRPIVGLLEVGWILILLLYTVIPTSVTFIFLYRSCWHRGITGVARTVSLIFLSCAIFIGVLIVFLLGLVLGVMVYSTYIEGFACIHY